MAVAADSHRDFLIPEISPHGGVPTTNEKRSDELRYSFVQCYYIINFAFFKQFRENTVD